MPLPLTVSCFSKIRTGFTLVVSLTRVVPDKEPLNGCLYVIWWLKFYTLLSWSQFLGLRPQTPLMLRSWTPLEVFRLQTSKCCFTRATPLIRRDIHQVAAATRPVAVSTAATCWRCYSFDFNQVVRQHVRYACVPVYASSIGIFVASEPSKTNRCYCQNGRMSCTCRC